MSIGTSIALHFCRMTLADLDDVALIERAAYDFPWTRTNFEDSLANGYTGVCVRGETARLLGYCVLMPVVDEMHVLNLCVAPAAQRMGIGLALLQESARLARVAGMTSLLLEVRPSNTRALHLYERFGFAVIGQRKNYYPAPARGREHAIVMRCQLQAAPASSASSPATPQFEGAGCTDPMGPSGTLS